MGVKVGVSRKPIRAIISDIQSWFGLEAVINIIRSTCPEEDLTELTSAHSLQQFGPGLFPKHAWESIASEMARQHSVITEASC